MRGLQDVRNLPNQLSFLARTPIIDAVDGEIMARFVGRVQIADLVADDQKALVYQSGKMRFESYGIPNIKHGVNMTQEMLNQLDALAAGMTRDEGIFTQWERNTQDGLLLGYRQRQEALIIAMHLDDLDYNRFGIKLAGVGWGMPSNLKVTLSGNARWTEHATAEPVNNVWNLKRVALTQWGQVFDRMTLGTQAFQEMIACTEFQNKARTYLAPNVSYVNLPLDDTMMQKNIAMSVLGLKEIEIYDWRHWSQNEDGTLTSTAFWPIDKVGFTSTADDNNPMAYDFANGVATESIVANLVPGGMIGNLGGLQRGPVSYVTGEHNPPQVTYWVAGRGFPRKHLLQSSAVLDVGTITDTIPVSDPF